MNDTPVCASCGTRIAPRLLVCPSCQRLVHAARLESLASAAAVAKAGGDPTAALEAWREAIDLLPPRTRQHQRIAAEIDALGREIERGGGAPKARKGARRWGGAAGVGAAGVLAFLATKGKLLLLGLTKAGTFLSMALAFGFYWTIFGWKFALGLVASIYVHEMGHVVALRRYGIRATAPMFLPGIGAIVRLKQYPVTAREDARVGIAGPEWGTAAALVAALGFVATGAPILAAVAQVGAWINLFNLLPLGQLDGGRAFRTLSAPERWAASAAIGIAWFLSREGLLVLLAIVAVARALGKGASREPDRAILGRYVALIAVLTALTLLPVPGSPTAGPADHTQPASGSHD
jgi:Zn-dependent protease